MAEEEVEELREEEAVGSTQESREVALTLEASARPESTSKFRSSSVTGRTGRVAGLGGVLRSQIYFHIFQLIGFLPVATWLAWQG